MLRMAAPNEFLEGARKPNWRILKRINLVADNEPKCSLVIATQTRITHTRVKT
jgi:hypothetical protein